MKTSKIMEIAGIILIIIFFISIIHINITDEKHIEQTDCYDKFSNKIVGATCESEVLNNDLWSVGVGLGAIGFLLLIFGILGGILEN